MDIDEFLDRELFDLGLAEKTGKSETIEMPLKEEVEPSTAFEGVKDNLSKGNLEQAEQSYIQLWHVLLKQKLKWNKELYEQLLTLNRQVSSVITQAYDEAKKKSDYVYGLIDRARIALKEGKKEIALKLYPEVQEISSSIPNVFFEEKEIAQGQVMDFYKELKNITDSELIKRVSSLIAELNQVINKIDMSLKSKNFVNAAADYDRCIDLFNQIPEGFLKQKNSIGIRLLEIYKNLSINTEISDLQKQLGIDMQKFSISPRVIAQPMPTQLKPRPLTQRAMPAIPKQVQKAAIKPMSIRARSIQTAKGIVTKPPIKTSHIEDSRSMLLKSKKERAKRNVEKGFYNEASKDIEQALQIEPDDVEAKVMRAKIKTLS